MQKQQCAFNVPTTRGSVSGTVSLSAVGSLIETNSTYCATWCPAVVLCISLSWWLCGKLKSRMLMKWIIWPASTQVWMRHLADGEKNDTSTIADGRLMGRQTTSGRHEWMNVSPSMFSFFHFQTLWWHHFKNLDTKRFSKCHKQLQKKCKSFWLLFGVLW